MATNRSNLSACPVQCTGCPELAVDPSATSTPLAGWRLARLAAATFLLPLLIGLAGALIAPPSPPSQLLGCLLGLAAGIAIVRWLVPARDKTKRSPEQ